MKKTLNPEDITAIIDTREQLPYDLSPLKTTREKLDTGDYSVLGLESEIAVERKSLSDLLGCVGNERDRFDREMVRLLSYRARAVVVEASWDDIRMHNLVSRSRVSPESVMGSILGWMAMGIPILLAGSRENAQKAVSRMLFIAARRRWRELATFFAARTHSEPSLSRTSCSEPSQIPCPNTAVSDQIEKNDRKITSA